MLKKRGAAPTQPRNRSAGYRKKRKQPTLILHRFAGFFKRRSWPQALALALVALSVFFLLHWLIVSARGTDKMVASIPETPTPTPTHEATEAPTFVFMDDEGIPVDWEHLTDAWAAEAGYEKRYALTDAERLEIAQVITAEAVGEPFAGKVAVAQCILQVCEDEGIRPSVALERYKYSTRRPEPTEEALEAVEAVFDFGHVATNEPIRYFYAPDLVESNWHESQVYVMTINKHKFFKEAEQ
ncbi:hypothetical protein [uncultured Alistipes sp.]|uniref:hypothetical protein n=1 Tax=uncultured Alistipes sp. TaxID=538949 RepID=UPI002666A0D5|nr:hypothetical protein [uncultured Alistipes sp.]